MTEQEFNNKEEYLICIGGNWNIVQYFEGNWYTRYGCYSDEWLDDDQPVIPLKKAIEAYKNLSTPAAE